MWKTFAILRKTATFNDYVVIAERGGRKPTLETLYRISCALDVKMSDIVKEIEKNLK
jgi:transcriptional regulator with XRE-family HTH domain